MVCFAFFPSPVPSSLFERSIATICRQGAFKPPFPSPPSHILSSLAFHSVLHSQEEPCLSPPGTRSRSQRFSMQSLFPAPEVFFLLPPTGQLFVEDVEMLSRIVWPFYSILLLRRTGTAHSGLFLSSRSFFFFVTAFE